MPTDTATCIHAAERVTLYYKQGGSDKVYQAAVEPGGGGFVVNFAFGRRGSALQAGTKTPAPVPYGQAKKVFDQLVRAKTAKGYAADEGRAPYAHSGDGERSTGLLPQLLNPIDEEEAGDLLADDAWWAQEKFGGRRLLVRKRGGEVVGFNRTGLTVALPPPVVAAVRGMLSAQDRLLDGEAVGEVYHVFDALERDGRDLRSLPYSDRYEAAVDLADGCVTDHVRYAPASTDATAKRAMLDRLRRTRRDGLVFKRHDAPYAPGRPTSGGTQRKLKFTASCSCLVAGADAGKRSVRLELLDEAGRRVGVGSVTVPPDRSMPAAGRVVDVRYLYAYRGGALYQPVYLGRRDDVGPEDCRLSQLKYRADGAGGGDTAQGATRQFRRRRPARRLAKAGG